MTEREEAMEDQVREADDAMEGDSDDSIHYEDVDTEEELEEEEGSSLLTQCKPFSLMSLHFGSQFVSEEEEDEGGEEGEGEGEDNGPPQTYLPGKPLEEGEELVCDENAYIMYHQANTGKHTCSINQKNTFSIFEFVLPGAPCLSFDIIPDGLGSERTEFPHTTYLIAGTQAATSFTNRLIVMKMSNMQKTQPKEESESEDSEDEEEGDIKPDLECAIIHHQGSVNRVRVRRNSKSLILSMIIKLSYFFR